MTPLIGAIIGIGLAVAFQVLIWGRCICVYLERIAEALEKNK